MFFSSHGNFLFFFFIYSNFKSTGFLFQEHAGIKKNQNKTKPPPTILSTQTLAKHKHLETGKKISTLFSLQSNKMSISPINWQRGIQAFSLK